MQAEGYSGVAIALHWLIALLAVINFALGWTSHLLKESALDQLITNTHKAIGISVLALSLVRLGWRLVTPPPPLPASMGRRDIALSHGVHWLLYAGMIAVPVAGWWMTSAFPMRHPIFILGIVRIPFLPVAIGMPNAILAHDTHRWLAVAFAALVAGHIGAALRHHYLLKDAVLARMSPVRRTSR